MFEELSMFWEKWGFEILVVLSVLIILIMAFFRRGKKGTWDSSYTYIPSKSTRKPPQESKGEIECRKVLEEIFGTTFPKARPNILRNSVTSENGSDFNLELDCYNERLKLAVEYNGQQHYKYIPYFHKTRDAFQNQKYRDYMKRDLCQKNGIMLIEVPYTVKVVDIENYIKSELKKKGYKLSLQQ
jgi:hypothetical protein